MSTSTKEPQAKQSSWAVQVVADQTGKSYFEGMSPSKFSEFLYTMIRYKNKYLFSLLATIIKFSEENKWRIERFWNVYVCEGKPRHAVTELDMELLEKRPEGWDLKNFEDFLVLRLLDFAKLGGFDQKNKEFGKTNISSYTMHVETNYFQELINNENITISDWNEYLNDWKDAVSGLRSKNHYLKNKVLSVILQTGMRLQEKSIATISESIYNKQYNSENIYEKSFEMEVDKLQRSTDRIFETIKSILKKGLHSFEQEEYTIISEQLYINQISLLRHSDESCTRLGKEFFENTFGKFSIIHYEKNPECLDIAGVLWSKQKRQEAIDKYDVAFVKKIISTVNENNLIEKR